MRQGKYAIIRNERAARDVFIMVMVGDTSAFSRPGQFVNIKVDGVYLRRPFSVMDWDEEGFTIMYKVVGEGSRIMSGMRKGDGLDILTGLGNGFDDSLSERPLLIGGGVGVPPLYGLARRFVDRGAKPVVLLGFASPDHAILVDEMRDIGCHAIVTLETEGQRVTDRLDEAAALCDCYYTCGPEGMLRAVRSNCGLPGQISLETRMACGIGLCRGCTCLTVDGGRRVCVDGPVFSKDALPW